MNHTEPYTASPAQGHSNAYWTMEETVRFYLELGDSQAARMHTERLVGELAIFYDIGEAYRNALMLITQWEKAERQKAEERERQREEERRQRLLHDLEMLMQNKGKAEDKAKEAERKELTDQLRTEQAMVLWRRLQQAGLVDENLQPVGMSRTEAAYVADQMAERLKLHKKWKTFEALWHRKNMRNDYYEALEQKKNYEWQDVVKTLLSDL